MHLLLFIFYGLLCGYAIPKIPFFRKTGIRSSLLLSLFALHVLTGCLHNLIAWRYYPGHGDIWQYFANSLQDHRLLTSNFHQLVVDNARWTYISHDAITFIQMILNLFSHDNLYVNTLLFSFPVFLGNAALYRLFRRRFPADPLTAIAAFILPSTLFWTSCIHREAVLYMLLGFLFYLLDRQANPSPLPASTSPKRRRLVFIGICFLLIAFFRIAVAVVLAPALLSWRLLQRPPSRRQLSALAAAGVFIIALLFAVPRSGSLPIRALSQVQNSFQILEAHSRLYLPALDGTWRSLLHTLPAAALNGLFEPLPGSGGQASYLAFSLELILVWGIIGAALTRKLVIRRTPAITSRTPAITSRTPAITSRTNAIASRTNARSLSFPLCLLLFSILGMLLTGLIVPFAGAIVRYRSIYLPFLLAPFLHYLCQWPPLYRLNQRLAAWLPNPPGSPISN